MDIKTYIRALWKDYKYIKYEDKNILKKEKFYKVFSKKNNHKIKRKRKRK